MSEPSSCSRASSASCAGPSFGARSCHRRLLQPLRKGCEPSSGFRDPRYLTTTVVDTRGVGFARPSAPSCASAAGTEPLLEYLTPAQIAVPHLHMHGRSLAGGAPAPAGCGSRAAHDPERLAARPCSSRTRSSSTSGGPACARYSLHVDGHLHALLLHIHMLHCQDTARDIAEFVRCNKLGLSHFCFPLCRQHEQQRDAHQHGAARGDDRWRLSAAAASLDSPPPALSTQPAEPVRSQLHSSTSSEGQAGCLQVHKFTPGSPHKPVPTVCVFTDMLFCQSGRSTRRLACCC